MDVLLLEDLEHLARRLRRGLCCGTTIGDGGLLYLPEQVVIGLVGGIEVFDQVRLPYLQVVGDQRGTDGDADAAIDVGAPW